MRNAAPLFGVVAGGQAQRTGIVTVNSRNRERNTRTGMKAASEIDTTRTYKAKKRVQDLKRNTCPSMDDPLIKGPRGLLLQCLQEPRVPIPLAVSSPCQHASETHPHLCGCGGKSLGKTGGPTRRNRTTRGTRDGRPF